jgi:hypothetical protein
MVAVLGPFEALPYYIYIYIYIYIMADMPLSLGFQTVPSLSYQLLTSHNYDSQLN